MFFSRSQFASVLIFTLPSLSCLTVGLPCGDSLIHQDSIDILVSVLPSLQLHEKRLCFSDKAEHFFWNRVCVCVCVCSQTSSVCLPVIWADMLQGKMSRRFCRSWMEKSHPPSWSASVRSANTTVPVFPHTCTFCNSQIPSFNSLQPGYNYNTEWDIAHHPHTLCLTHIMDFVFICCRGVGHMLTKKPLFWNCLRLGAMEII